MFYKNSLSGIEHIVIENYIKREENKKITLCLQNEKNDKEGRNTLFPKTKNKYRKEEDALWDKFDYWIDTPNLSDLVPWDTGWTIYQSEALTVLYLYVRLLFPVGLELYRL